MSRSPPPFPTPAMPLQDCIKGCYVKLGTREAADLIAAARKKLAAAARANKRAMKEKR